MSNSNVIVGEVEKLEHGLLEYSVDDIVNRLQIKWEYVTRLTTDQQMDVELEDGSGFYGSLIESDADDELRILTAFGTFDVKREMVVEIVPIKGTFWKRLEGDVSAGLSFTKSTDLLQFNLGGKAQYRKLKSQTDFNYHSIVTSQEDDTARTNSSLQLTHLRFFKKRWFYRGDAVGSRNDELGIDFRGSLAGGVGRHLIQTNRVHLLFSTLLSGNREFTNDGQITNNLEMVFDTDLAAFRYDTPKLELDTGLAFFTSLTTDNRFRVNFDTRLTSSSGSRTSSGISASSTTSMTASHLTRQSPKTTTASSAVCVTSSRLVSTRDPMVHPRGFAPGWVGRSGRRPMRCRCRRREGS